MSKATPLEKRVDAVSVSEYKKTSKRLYEGQAIESLALQEAIRHD